MVYPFSEEAYRHVMALLKTINKASGRDVLVVQLNNIGTKAHRWMLAMLNKCFMEKISQPYGESPRISPYGSLEKTIALVCQMYKLYERIILNIIVPTIQLHLIIEHAGFRPGKSFSSQLIN